MTATRGSNFCGGEMGFPSPRPRPRSAGHRPLNIRPRSPSWISPPSAAPRRRAPPQGRLCGRSPASSERRRVASLVAVPAGAPVSVARPRPRPKGTTAPAGHRGPGRPRLAARLRSFDIDDSLVTASTGCGGPNRGRATWPDSMTRPTVVAGRPALRPSFELRLR